MLPHHRTAAIIAGMILPLLLLTFMLRADEDMPPPKGPARLYNRHRRQIDVGADGYKNATQVGSAFKEALSPAAAATAIIFSDEKPVALGTVVDADGWIVSKSTLIGGAVTCQLADKRQLEARVAGRDERCDLALLKVDAKNLRPVAWRGGDLPAVGSIVAAASTGAAPLAIGVVSDVPQRILGPTKVDSQRGWLGVRLGGNAGDTEIQQIVPDSAAEKAGLKVADRVKTINGVPMQSVQQVIETVGNAQVGKKIELVVLRGDKELTLSATLLSFKDSGTTNTAGMPQDGWGGGPFSERRRGFPVVIPHDLAIAPSECGGPLVDIDGKVVGINIARALRVTSYALPAKVVQESVAKLRQLDAGAPVIPAVPSIQKK